MALNNNFPFVPEDAREGVPYLLKLMKSLNFAMKGKLNCTGKVTLTASASSTTVTDNRCLANSVILMQPTTANAGALGAAGHIVASSGSFVITHPNNAQTDRTFNYAILG